MVNPVRTYTVEAIFNYPLSLWTLDENYWPVI